MAQEELNSFLAVAEDLQVRGLSQKSGNRDVHSNTKDPHRRDHIVKPATKPIPPKKHPQPAPPQIPSVHCKAYQNENDDIQDIVPVKSEPLPVPTEVEAKSYTAMVEQTYPDPTQQQQEGILADNSMEEYGVEEYNDYAEYEGMEAEYSSTGAHVPEGNKGEIYSDLYSSVHNR